MGKVSPVPIMKDLGAGGATGFWDLSRKRRFACLYLQLLLQNVYVPFISKSNGETALKSVDF